MTTPNDPHNWSPVSQLQLVANTAPGGAALQNATPTFLTWNVPNDGQPHMVLVIANKAITGTETGGAVGIGGTLPGGTTFASATQLFAGAQTGSPSGSAFRLLAPGSQFTVSQSSALTAGGPSLLSCQVWGA